MTWSLGAEKPHPASACPNCTQENVAGDLWCARCGVFLDGDREQIVSLAPAGGEAGTLAPRPIRRRGFDPSARTWGNVAMLVALGVGIFALERGPLGLSLQSLRTGPLSSVVAAPTPSDAGLARLTLTAAAPGPSPVLVDQVAAPAPVPSGQPATARPAVVAPAVPPPVIAQLGTFASTSDGPAAAVTAFYQAVQAHAFGPATGLWSPRMLAAYPPATYIDHRFSATQSVAIRQNAVQWMTADAASVGVDLLEVNGGVTRHWVGTWRLVHGPSGWLLDQPNFWCCW